MMAKQQEDHLDCHNSLQLPQRSMLQFIMQTQSWKRLKVKIRSLRGNQQRKRRRERHRQMLEILERMSQSL